MYYLDNSFTKGREERPWTAMIVGVGGTGAFVAESLCRLLDKNKTEIVLVDMDIVEERNLIRQNFFPNEIGHFKSEALATRLSRTYNRRIGFSTFPIIQTSMPNKGLIIGCVDNGLARRDISKKEMPAYWWIDAGNGENYGQILIGNDNRAEFDAKKQICYNLPSPIRQRPELRTQTPPVPDLNCIEIAVEQGPTINQIVASLTVEVVRRLVIGKCPWIQILVDMEHGTMQPVMAEPGIVEKMFNTKSKNKIIMRGE